MLREHLAHLPDFEDVDALDAAFAHALGSPLIYAALGFLVAWPRLDLAARLVVERRAQWDGRHYEILAPAAEALESRQPLAATILYRALIDSILARGQSPAYPHAARYHAESGRRAARGGDLADRPGANLPRRVAPAAWPQARVLEFWSTRPGSGKEGRGARHLTRSASRHRAADTSA